MPTPPKTDRRAKPFKKLPIEGILKITDKLREVCSKGEDGLAIYADGWNDKSVAETLNLDHPTPEKYVAFYRGKLFGRVRPVSQPRQAGIAAEASARIAKLETAVHKLLSHLGCDPAEFGL